jgi:hypothetical protein
MLDAACSWIELAYANPTSLKNLNTKIKQEYFQSITSTKIMFFYR